MHQPHPSLVSTTRSAIGTFLRRPRFWKFFAIALGGVLLVGSVFTPAFSGEPILPNPSPAELPLERVELGQVQSQSSNSLGLDEQLWGEPGRTGDWRNMLRAIDQSLRYLDTPLATQAYRRYPVSGVTRDRVRRSLVRFRQLLVAARTPEDLQASVEREFDLYQAIGRDGQGTVDFTGYFEPVYTASRRRTNEFRYPLYKLPPNFSRWSKPHPTRRELEGEDGLQGTRGRLRGLELVWLRDRLESYLVQVQGSARLRLTDGSTIGVGYAGRTDHPYTSLGRELVNDGKFRAEELTLPRLLQYFREHPQDLSRYIARNPRFIFFRETPNASPLGTLNVPVTAERSIATDRTLMPPGALALIHTEIPYPSATGDLEQRLVSRYVLDQDTGGAIRGPGRVDIFMGTGAQAGDRAGLINTPGELYYLLLKR